MTIAIRDMVEGDRPFIFNSFMRSYDAAADTNTRPYPIHCFAHLLDIGVCKVACAAEHTDVIIGWALVVGRTLEYVYVKKDARRCGIARDLVRAIGDVTRAGCTTAPWTREYAERFGR